MNLEKIKKISEITSNTLIAVSIIIGGIWSFNIYHKLREEDKSSLQLEKIRKELDGNIALNIGIRTKTYPNIKKGTHTIIIEVDISNKGSRYLNIDLSDQMIITKFNIDKNNNLKILESSRLYPYSYLPRKIGNACYGDMVESKQVMPNTTDTVHYITNIEEKTNYMIVFVAKIDGETNKEINNLVNSVDVKQAYWAAREYVRIN